MSNLKRDHGHTAVEERHNREAALDETIANSFPASDPPSSIPNPDDHVEAIRFRGTMWRPDGIGFQVVGASELKEQDS